MASLGSHIVSGALHFFRKGDGHELLVIDPDALEVRVPAGVALIGGGGGGSDFTVWSPDAPPLIPGALDDEFTVQGAGVPTGWTEYDPDGVQAVSVGPSGLILNQALPAGNAPRLSGIYKAIPAGDFTFETKFCTGLPLSVDPPQFIAGLALFEDATDPSKQIVVWGESWPGKYHLWLYTDSHTSSGDIFGDIFGVAQYWRARRSGTTYTFDISAWGLSFGGEGEYAMPFVPQHVGLVVSNGRAFGAGSDFEVFMAAANFRYADSDVGLGGFVGGARVNGAYA